MFAFESRAEYPSLGADNGDPNHLCHQCGVLQHIGNMGGGWQPKSGIASAAVLIGCNTRSTFFRPSFGRDFSLYHPLHLVVLLNG